MTEPFKRLVIRNAIFKYLSFTGSLEICIVIFNWLIFDRKLWGDTCRMNLQYACIVSFSKNRFLRSPFIIVIAFIDESSGSHWLEDVGMKNIVSWVVTPDNFERSRHFGGFSSASVIFLLSLFCVPGYEGDRCLRNVGLSPNYAVLEPMRTRSS
jgi:hypothetical protein